MKQEWINKLKKNRERTLSLLFYPALNLQAIKIKELFFSAINQATTMKIIADKCPLAGAVGIIDLSLEAEMLGAVYSFVENKMPVIKKNIIIDRIETLHVPAAGSGRDGINIMAINKATTIIKDRPIFAVATGPYSIANELLGEAEITVAAYEKPQFLEILMEKVTRYVNDYIQKLKNAGAAGLIINDPATSRASTEIAEKFSLRYLQRICTANTDKDFVIIYHNSGNVILLADAIAQVDADIYYFGTGVDILEMLKRMPKHKVVMGNLDPYNFVTESPASVAHATQNLLMRCDEHENFVPAIGGIIPHDAAWDNIMAFFATLEVYLPSK